MTRIELLEAALRGELEGEHIYNGGCPEYCALDDRDPHCPQCQRLVAAGFGAMPACEEDCDLCEAGK